MKTFKIEVLEEDVKEVAQLFRKARGTFAMSNDVWSLLGDFCRENDPVSNEECYRQMGFSEKHIKELLDIESGAVKK